MSAIAVSTLSAGYSLWLMTFHKDKNKAICHHCSFERDIIIKCKNGDNCNFIMYGLGVEKIFEEVKKNFPNNKINIFSSDYMNLLWISRVII